MRSSVAGTCRIGSSTPAATAISAPVAPLTSASASSTLRRKAPVVARGGNVEDRVIRNSIEVGRRLAPRVANRLTPPPLDASCAGDGRASIT
jgi:hypothetical protein